MDLPAFAITAAATFYECATCKTVTAMNSTLKFYLSLPAKLLVAHNS